MTTASALVPIRPALVQDGLDGGAVFRDPGAKVPGIHALGLQLPVQGRGVEVPAAHLLHLAGHGLQQSSVVGLAVPFPAAGWLALGLPGPGGRTPRPGALRLPDQGHGGRVPRA